VSEYSVEGVSATYIRSMETFGSVLSDLEDGRGQGWTHAGLEGFLTERMREVARQIFQDVMDSLSAGESRVEAVGSDGIARTRVESGHTRGLTTVFGPVTVSRKAYRAPGAANLSPLDAVLNLPVGKYSDGIAKLAVTEAVRGSYDDAVAAIERSAGVKVGKPQLIGLVVDAAVDVEGFYAARRPTPSPDTDALVLTCDGKGIRMREEALRASTRKTTTSRKLVTRASPGEKSGRKRMAELGAVYDIAPAPREAADVIATPGRKQAEQRKGPVARDKWVVASVVDDIPAVVTKVFDEAQRRDPHHRRTWIALADGNKQQIDAIAAEAARREVSVTVLIDFIHVLEYMWGAAWSFFDKGDPAAETWVAEQARKVLDGRSGDVAAGIRRRATRFGYSPGERKGADDAATYLDNKRDHLDYPTALAEGWPIATGIIEGLCRHLVKDRFDITGARWGLNGAEALLALRAVVINGDLEQYWTYHLLQEQHRRHETRYRHHQNDYTLAG
jgi:hypothetical protein